MAVSPEVDPVLSARGKIAYAVACKDVERELAARRQLAVARAAREITAACSGDNPITDDQRWDLAALLWGGGRNG